jgi:hypothetical protein
MSVVVAGALFAILEVSLRQTTRVTDYIQASQLGRITMTKIVDELHSACIAPGFAPVLEKSTPSELRFVTAFSGAAEIASAQEHRIKFEGGVLSDSSFANNPASAWPTFTFKEGSTSVTRIGEHIEQSEKEPVFRYYKYATASNGGEEEVAGKKTATGLNALQEIPVVKELGSASAKETAAVLIRFRALPTNGNNKLNRGADMNTQVVLAFSAPGAEATIKDAPCN